VTLANLPGDGEDIIYVLMDEFQNKNKERLTAQQLAMLPDVREVFLKYNGHQCSMFGAWGKRTVNGQSVCPSYTCQLFFIV
jgi:hypothetical protein